jgi:hypothetical protein
MSTLTIRNLPDELMDKLRQAKEQRGESINTIVLKSLLKAFAVGSQRRELSRYTTWTEEDFDEFMGCLEQQRKVDDDLWR